MASSSSTSPNPIAIWPSVCLAVLTIAALAHFGAQWPRLPDLVGTHFNAQGVADHLMSKTAYAIWEIGLLVGHPLFLIGIAYVGRYLPDSLQNMPNKEYWLHPDRREAVFRDMTRLVIWIACLCQLLMIVVSHEVFLANTANEKLSSLRVYLAVGLFITAILVLVVRQYIKYARVGA